MTQRDAHDADQIAALERALRESFQAHFGDPPDATALWSKMGSTLPARNEPRRTSIVQLVASAARGRRRRSLLPKLALVAFLLLAVSAAAYSASQLLHPLLHVPAAEGRHYTQIGLTKSAGDITVVI